MQLTPLIAVHMSAALGAIALGPVALWARGAARQHPSCTAPSATPGSR
jgi:hypothetical protein